MRNLNRLIVSIYLVAGCAGCQTPQPPDAAEISEITISEIHEAFGKGQLTSEQLVRFYIDRIATVDWQINAITVVNPEAVAIARELDTEFTTTKVLRPLHGIPVIVKDNINTRTLPTTAGALALADHVPEEDAFIIKRLVEAGAIVLAKSNMAEWAFSPMHTESSTAGTTLNPYNTRHVPAGSSGGTAAAIAANFGVIGLGTDTGNSIRGPASHCALVGFRTTQGLISRGGIVPLLLRNDIVGPMARTVEDAVSMLEVIAGYDPEDPITERGEAKTQGYRQFLNPNGLKGTRVGVLTALSNDHPDPEVEGLFGQALADMAALGAEIIYGVEIPDLKSLKQNQWCADFRKDVEAFLQTIVRKDGLLSVEDIIRVGSHSAFAAEGLAYFAINAGRDGSECLDVYLDQRSIALREAIESVMDHHNLAALVYPTWNTKPAQVDRFKEEYGGDNSQEIAPHTGQPAFTVPMGFTSHNLPAGIQFLGMMFDEPTLIQLVYAYEQGTRHRKPPGLK